MPLVQMKRKLPLARIAVIFLLLFVYFGCTAQKSETVKTSEGESVQESAVVAPSQDRQITRIGLEQAADSLLVRIQGNRKLVYTSIKQSFPFGIAVYLPETGIAEGLIPPKSEFENIGNLLVDYADLEKTTAKIEILLNEDLNYEMIEGDSSLTVKLVGVETSETANAPEVVRPELPQPIVQKMEQKTVEPGNAPQPVVVPDKTATMTDIEFTTLEDGKSDIVVKTSHPIQYDIIQGKENKLYLNLYNTVIPDHHKRPILTYYFKSAVESLMPIQMPGKNRTAKIEINTRDQVPYRVVQDQNTLSLFFEASTVEPPEFTKSKKKVVSGTAVTESRMSGQQQDPGMKSPMMTQAEKDAQRKEEEEAIFGAPKVYTGEKIKLDFYDTDIKNVFRILKSVGGLNFAIDKNVKGKVTLSLQDPVPWDQVLDLVLRMNNLGQKKEGNVIRIATLETLSKEEKLRQDAIAAHKKTLAQKKSLEPLITEYIPINYSDAEADIKPHISSVLTKDRGTLSVDARTNMIIVTDTQEKINQVREIIYRLDKVTPQIMIEAKVVEVTKNFTRTLGVGLSLSDQQGVATSGVQDYTVALNHPIAAPANTGTFNFFRLFGSSVTALNAQISASEVTGDVKVVSSPRILTLDNKSAKIKQGLEYAYQEESESGGTTTKFKSIDLLLEVTPHVTPDQRIAMKVYVTKNDVNSITNGIPSLATNEAETELLVNNNDTIVIGGIVKSTDNKGTSGTPFLSGIPIIGRLFRTDTDTDNRNEMLIFITPSIVQLDQKRNAYVSEDNKS